MNIRIFSTRDWEMRWRRCELRCGNHQSHCAKVSQGPTCHWTGCPGCHRLSRCSRQRGHAQYAHAIELEIQYIEGVWFWEHDNPACQRIREGVATWLRAGRMDASVAPGWALWGGGQAVDVAHTGQGWGAGGTERLSIHVQGKGSWGSANSWWETLCKDQQDQVSGEYKGVS